jgi:protease IV
MKDFMKYTLATVVGILLYSIVSMFLFFGIIGIIASATQNKVVKVKPNSILYMKLDQPIVDRASDNPLDNFNFASLSSEPQIGLNKFIESLKNAKTDDNVKGIFMELSYIPAGFATLEEIRNALIDFKESGKFVYTYADVMTQGTYYVASASDKIYMNPTGSIIFKGLQANVMFFKHTLEKLGVEPVIFRHGKFKSAIEPYFLDKMSDANKEQMTVLLNGMWNHVVEKVALSRNLSKDEVNRIADGYLARNTKKAVETKLIDAAKYRDEVIDELVTLTNAEKPEKLEFIKLEKYFDANPAKKSKKIKKDKIAVIYASGEISTGKGENQSIGSETISQALREARRDSTVKAIVFRVNSPGGEALASDIIWREASLAQKAKPFIVSMGDYAASGGYYISCIADTIVASEVTLTGSIGVFGLMFNTQKLMNDKLGITFDGVKTNQFGDFPNGTRAMSAAEKEIIQGEIEDIYSTFIEHVGQGRNMSTANVDSIGQGRVWSGISAKQLGLIDVFGGLSKAIEIAAEKSKVQDYKIEEYPKHGEPLEELIKQLTGEVKTNLIKNELGDNYFFYQKLNDLKKIQGIQTRMEYDLEIY